MADKPKRRHLHFDSIDEGMAEAERLAACEVETTGHYSFGQILEHLARAIDTVTGELDAPPLSGLLKLVVRLIRPIMLSRPLRPGFKLPAKSQSVLWPPEEVNVTSGMKHLTDSLDRYKKMDTPLPHPAFGKMNRQQHDQGQCRHFELHLSFVHPK